MVTSSAEKKEKNVEVILDTSFLMIPHFWKIDIFSELDYLIEGNYNLIIFTNVIEELENISKSRGKDGTAARVALKLLGEMEKRQKVSILKASGGVDSSILNYIEGNSSKDLILCTNDYELKKRAKKLGCRIITLREKDRIDFA